MSGLKGTPGPWHVAGGCQIRSDRDQIAKVWMMRGGEGKANAKLISAAPELLEALGLAINNFGQDDDDWTDMARAAIAKALGE